ncbi:MAG: glycine radical domain-containing protein [Armatimonadota bacterium]
MSPGEAGRKYAISCTPRGSHLHFNIMDAAGLRRAQANPQNHAALTVRVSGYSARFVTVDKRWQDALIERAERGM